MNRLASPEIRTDPGDGPRHAIVSRDGRFLFVLNELGSSVASYEILKPLGFRRVGKWSTLPADYNRWAENGQTLVTKAAAIKMTRDGRVLMASNRGHDSIAFFDVNQQNGELALRSICKLSGHFPRDFELMPGERFMLVGHKTSNEVQVYRFDRPSCRIVPIGAAIPLWRPLCFKFAPQILPICAGGLE